MVAHSDYFVPAARTASELGLATELGLALCFDIQVQNGGVKPGTRRAITPLVGSGNERAVAAGASENGPSGNSQPL